MTLPDPLAELLARATGMGDAVGVAVPTPASFAPREETFGGDVDGAPIPDPEVDDPGLAEVLELAGAGVKADSDWQACPSCGGGQTDEYADGTARCEDCGTPLTRAGGSKADDALDVDDVALEFKELQLLAEDARPA